MKELILPNKDNVVDCKISPEEYEIFRKFNYKCNKIIFVPKNNDRVDIQDIILPKELVNNSMNSFLKDRIEKNVDMSK